MVKLGIVGWRNFSDYHQFRELVEQDLQEWGLKIRKITVISGGALGTDTLAKQWARANKIQIREYLPDWSQGRAGGPIRNTRIADDSDYLIAFPSAFGRGTQDTINKFERSNRPIKVHWI